ncbi:MAG: hypothetical protein M5U34_46595 [Chloroflexi bacterium]|nr:hypothetical protein [Chloroflexota bacterium]
MMKIAPFSIEEFFAVYEFTTPYSLCSSDCESMTVAELLALAEMDMAGLAALHLGYTESQGTSRAAGADRRPVQQRKSG